MSALLREPRRPAWVARRPDAHWFAVATVCVGAFMGQLDVSIVTLALPSLRHDLHAGLGAVEWVALGYTMVLVGGVAVVGRLADRVGRKLLYTYGFVVFTAGSLLAGVAPSLPLLVGARVLQGAGAAMLQANSVALIAHVMPRDRLGRGIGVQGSAQALGLALGPSVGGLLIAVAGWRAIFFVNVPAGLVGTALGWTLLPRSRDLRHGETFDWPGAALLVPAVAAALAVLSFGDRLGWHSPAVLALSGGAALLVAQLVRHELAVRYPMLDLSLFRRTAFAAAVGSGLLSYLVLFGIMFAIPFYLEDSRHLDPATAGAVLTVLPVTLGLVAPFAGRLADQLGARVPSTAGMLLAAGALAAFAAEHAHMASLLAELALAGVGLGLFTPSNNAAIMGAVPRRQAGEASGVLNMTRGLGTSLGVALMGLVLGDAVAGPAIAPAAVSGAGALLASAALLAAVLSVMRGAPAAVRGLA